MHRLAAAAVAALLLTPVAAEARAAVGDLKSFGRWSVGCDNTRRCVAIGLAPEDAEGSGYLRVERGGEANAPVSLRLTSQGEIEGAPARSWSVRVEGAAPVSLPVIRDKDGGQAGALSGPAAVALLQAATGKGKALTVPGRPGLTVSLAGASAALRFMDDRQGRAGRVDALVARGGVAATGAAPAPPVVTLARAAPQTGLPKPPAALLRLPELQDCAGGAGGPDPTVARLASDLVVWAVDCGGGAYNLATYVYLSAPNGAGLRPADIENNTDGEGRRTHAVVNGGYDAATRRLTGFDKARGIGDCGADTEWGWDGRRFALLRLNIMGECGGVAAEDWPRLFVATPR